MEPSVFDRVLAIAALARRDQQRGFSGTPLTEARAHALHVLQHAGATTQQRLAEVLGTTPRSVSALVDGLEAAGLVERRAHPDDRRAVLVTSTPAAADVLARLAEERAALSADLLNAVDAADRAAFSRGVDAVFWELNGRVRSSPR